MISKNTFFKYTSLSLAVLALFFTSCKKDGTDSKDDAGEHNTFTIDGKKYKATQVSYIKDQNMLRAQRIVPGTGLNEVETISITFSDNELPETGGSFDIVLNPYSPGDRTNNNQVSLHVTTFPYDNGSYTDDKNYLPQLSPVQQVTITVGADKKVNVKFSNLTFKSDTGNSIISGNITLP